MKINSRVLEVFIAVFVGSVVYGVAIAVDAFDRLVFFMEHHESWELDEIILAIWITLVIGLFLVIHRLSQEIAARKKNEQILKDARNKAEELSQMKSNFLAMVSHELRTPLTSIIGFAKLIRRYGRDISECPGGDESLAKKLQRINENTNVIITEGDRLTELINNVLDLAKLESGHFEWHDHSVSMRDVLRQSIDVVRILAIDKGLVFQEDVDKELPVIKGDFDRLVQLCMNLLVNAVKFTPKGQVFCQAVAEDGDIIVRIMDTGIGVPEEDREVIFDKFRQLGDTLTDKPKGTGLGLPICKEIVEHHNGRIWCESNPHGGSTFVFSIPAG